MIKIPIYKYHSNSWNRLIDEFSYFIKLEYLVKFYILDNIIGTI